jgi:hypothetical protein
MNVISFILFLKVGWDCETGTGLAQSMEKGEVEEFSKF